MLSVVRNFEVRCQHHLLDPPGSGKAMTMFSKAHNDLLFLQKVKPHIYGFVKLRQIYMGMY